MRISSDQIVLEGISGKHERSDDAERKVRFSPFSGIGPRRYIDLFSLGLGSGYKIKRKREGGDKVDWHRREARARVPMLPNSYLDREKLASQKLKKRLQEHHERRQKESQHREES
ncbi:MAG TPA: hypothetical protein VLS89_17875 [Candidatus Nanopelagicales bacterium]|nr:hypothetical protein [Candidatus Nanopelagicales bacterium]